MDASEGSARVSTSPPLRVALGACRLTAVAALRSATLGVLAGPRVGVTDGSQLSHYEMVEHWQVPPGPAGVPIWMTLRGGGPTAVAATSLPQISHKRPCALTPWLL